MYITCLAGFSVQTDAQGGAKKMADHAPAPAPTSENAKSLTEKVVDGLIWAITQVGKIFIPAITFVAAIYFLILAWNNMPEIAPTKSASLSRYSLTEKSTAENVDDGPVLRNAGQRRYEDEEGDGYEERENRHYQRPQSGNKPCIVMCGPKGREVEIYRYLPNPPDSICFRLLEPGGDAQMRCNNHGKHRRRW